MEQHRDFRTIRCHFALHLHCHDAQPTGIQGVHASKAAHPRIPEEAFLHHHGHNDHNICHYSGLGTQSGLAELHHNGFQRAHRICMAAGSDTHFATIACEWRPDSQCLPHLCPPCGAWIHRHCLPYHSYPERIGEYGVSPTFAYCYRLAMGSSGPTQPEHTATGHVLHLFFTHGIHRIYRLFLDWIHADGCSDSHLVDHAAYVHTDHHLHFTMAEAIW